MTLTHHLILDQNLVLLDPFFYWFNSSHKSSSSIGFPPDDKNSSTVHWIVMDQNLIFEGPTFDQTAGFDPSIPRG